MPQSILAPSQTKEARKQYQLANPEKYRISSAKYRANNLDLVNLKRRSKSKAIRSLNKEKIAAGMVIYRERNAEKIALKSAEWSANNRDKRRIHDANRRAREIKSGGVLSAGLSAKLFDLQNGMCACCGKPLGEKYHMDHIMPLALGGLNEDSNIQLLLPKCNHQKCAKHPDDFMKTRQTS